MNESVNVPRVRHRDLDRILEVHWEGKVPLFLLGYAGTGKSYHIREWAKRKAQELGLRFVKDPREHVAGETFLFLDFRASQIEPTDIRGLPFPVDGTVEWKIPSFLPKGGEGVIFLDELNHALPSVLHALYQLILDRRVGESYRLPNGFLVVAAGNLSSEDPFLSEMPAPLRNRMSIYLLATPTADEWIEWAADKGIDSRVIAFIQKNPQYLHTWNDEGQTTVFATPRAWERVSRKIQGVERPEMIYVLAAADVGQEVAATFKAFVEEALNIPTIEEVLKRPERIREVKPHVALTYIGQLNELWERGRKQDVVKAVNIIGRTYPDVGIVMIRLLRAKYGTEFLMKAATGLDKDMFERLKAIEEKVVEFRGGKGGHQ